MKQTLNLKMGQSLAMTPQLQQAIKLLQLSTLELQTEIQAALENNPMLEMQEEEAADSRKTEISSDQSVESKDQVRIDERDEARADSGKESETATSKLNRQPWKSLLKQQKSCRMNCPMTCR